MAMEAAEEVESLHSQTLPLKSSEQTANESPCSSVITVPPAEPAVVAQEKAIDDEHRKSDTALSPRDIQATQGSIGPSRTPMYLTEAPTAPKPTRTETLSNTLQALQAERRVLLQKLSQLLSSSTPSNASTHATNSTPYLPSTHAHTFPIPPLTPSESDRVLAQARTIIKEHIGLLHQYNAIRDVGMGLIGIVADAKGVRIRECQEEFGVGEGD